MDFDYSWLSLVRPGLSRRFFETDKRIRFQPERLDYDLENAWWLSELSRLIYRQGEEELGGRAKPPSRQELLAGVGMVESHFFVQGNTQCAIVEGEGVAVLVFRGTNGMENWLSNFNAMPVPWSPTGQVHGGFKKEFDAIWPSVSRALADMGQPTFYAGHSLGGALAIMAASRQPPRATYTFGSPKVGDSGFCRNLAGVRLYRVVNGSDIVPTVPPFEFCHVGDCCLLNGDRSDYTFTPDYRKTPMQPPTFLIDHAPINYSARLELEISRRRAG